MKIPCGLPQGRFICLCAAVLVLAFSQSAAAPAQETKSAHITRQLKGLQGEVTWLGKDKIAIVYSRDSSVGGSEEEMLLPFDKNIIVEHASSLGQIKQGDMVYIKYEETVEEKPEGLSKTRQAKVISFVRPSARPNIHEKQSEAVPSEEEAVVEEESRTLKSQ